MISRIKSCLEFFDIITKRLTHKHQRVHLMTLELVEYLTVAYESRYFWKELNERTFLRALFSLYKNTYFDEVVLKDKEQGAVIGSAMEQQASN